MTRRGDHIDRGGRYGAIARLPVLVCLWLSAGTAAVALAQAPSPTRTLTATPTPKPTRTPTPFPIRTCQSTCPGGRVCVTSPTGSPPIGICLDANTPRCGGIAGLSCPEGLVCLAYDACCDLLGLCVPQAEASAICESPAGAAFSCPTQTPTQTPTPTCHPVAGLSDCQVDSDCVVVDQTDCCPCQMGGRQQAINRSKEDEFSVQQEVCCAAAGVCADVYQCQENVGAICHGGTCLLVLTAGTPTPTPTVIAGTCAGDCNGDSDVTIDEIITLVGVALNGCPSGGTCCASAAVWCGSGVTVDCIIQAVNGALYGCGIEPTPTPAAQCSSVPCGGDCVICPPCAPGQICNGALCTVGVCAVNPFNGCQCAPVSASPTPTPALFHGHTCCACENDACTDFAWVEVEPICPPGCETVKEAECAPSCRGGQQSEPASCAPLTPCTSAADCDDGDGCTVDQCTSDGCTHSCVCG
jgi:hypothetical protein